MDEQEFERDEQLLEARRLKRLEQRRRRKVQQRIVLGVLLVILILSMVLIVRGCKSRSAQQEQSGETADAQQNAPESVVPTEPDTTVTIAAVGDIMMYDEQLDAARQDDGTYDFTSSFAAVSGSTVSADLTVGNLELNFCGEPYSGKPDFRAPESLAKTLSSIGFDVLQTANTYSIQNGLSDFADELVPFGESMAEFSNAISGMNADLVSKAATAGKALAEMATTLPNSGGVVGFFAGENDMDKFGEQLVPFGKAMKDYSLAVKGMDVGAVSNSASAGKALVELSNTIPNCGGLVSFFTGDNSIADFGLLRLYRGYQHEQALRRDHTGREAGGACRYGEEYGSVCICELYECTGSAGKYKYPKLYRRLL